MKEILIGRTRPLIVYDTKTTMINGASINSGDIDVSGYEKLKLFVFSDQPGLLTVEEGCSIDGGLQYDKSLQYKIANASLYPICDVLEIHGFYVKITFLNNSGNSNNIRLLARALPC